MGTLTLDEYLKKKKEEENVSINEKKVSDEIMTLDEYNRSMANIDNAKTLDEYLGKNKKNISTKKEKKDTWFNKSELYKDNKGNVITDTLGTALATIGDVGVNLVKGVGGLAEGVTDLAGYGIADVVDLFGNEEKANKIRGAVQKSVVDTVFTPAQDYLDQYSVLGEKTDAITEGLGYVAGMTAVGYFTGGVGTTAMTFISGMGNGMTEALNDGATMEEARVYGAISGVGEAVSELMFGGLGKISGAAGLSKGIGEFDDVIIGGLTKKIKNKMVKTVIQSGLKAGGEGLEEIVSGLISSVGKKTTYMSEKEWSEIRKNENLLEQFWMGAITSAIAQGPSTLNSIRNKTDYISGKTENEQKVYDNLLETKTNEAKVQTAINNTIQSNRKVLEEAYGRKISQEELNAIKETVTDTYNAGKLNTDNIKLSNKKQLEIEESIEKDFEDGNISIETIRNILGENQDLSKDKGLQRSLYENEQKSNSFQFEKTDNEKINILLQSATDSGLNNTSKTKRRVEIISKLVQDTDRQYKFVNSEQLKELGYNENANGLINKETGEILINAQSNKEIQAVVGHETTHLFDSKVKGEYTQEYKDLQSAVVDYLKAKGTYETKINEIMDVYNKAGINLSTEEVMEEVTADTIGDNLFGENSEEFIRQLSTKNKNIFQKIYDYIKKIIKNIKGYNSEEQKTLNNLKEQFDKVYKTINIETSSDTKYSIGGERAIENIQKSDYYKKAVENLELAKKLKKEGKTNAALIKKTGWYQDSAGDWKFEFSDKDMELRKLNFAINKEYKLSEILNHDTLFYFYPDLANYTVIFDNKANSSYSEKYKTIYLSNDKLNNLTDLKGTLIHEIQHAVQHMENHAHGASTKKGLMRYYNTLGEIEAADTKRRYLNNIEGKRNTILPESAKINSTHTKVKNGNILVKIANGVYNFFHGGEKNVYKNKSSLEKNIEKNRPLVVERGRVDNTNSTKNDDVRLSLTQGKTNQDWLKQEITENDLIKNSNESSFNLSQNSENKEKSETNSKVKDNLSPENIIENDTPKKITRKMVREQILKEMNITSEDLSAGNDIGAINYQMTDPIRVNEKVFGSKVGKKINDLTINQTKHNTAEKIRWQNQEREEIRALGIKPRSKESAAVQKYAEKQFVHDDNTIQKYGDSELAREFPNKETRNKIKHAAKVLRNKYDNYIEQINKVITALGYDEIHKRDDYMRHFQELGDVFSKTGVPFNLNDMSAEDLPTDINGLTEFNKPGKSWFAQTQQRYGLRTTYDAITGIDGYLEGAGNLIFHTQDIQNYRAVSSLIRDTYGQKKGFEHLDGLSSKELNQRIDDIQNNKLSRYVAWLDEQANSLAGKKGAIDRGVERFLGRRGYTFFNTIKQQVGSNMTGFNVRSALTNLISTVQAGSKTNKIAFIKGTVSTINNMFHNDGFIDKSDFLTSRFGSDSLSKKLWSKVSNAGQIFMTGTDYFTANIVNRSKYYEGLQQGMTETEAIKYADDFSSRVMGDRSQGATGEAFNSKTLGLFTQFQLEVNNQWQYMIHDTKMDFEKNSKTSNGLKAGATMLFQLGQLAAYSYFFNEAFEKITGSRAAFDPVEIIKTLFGFDDEDDEKTFDERLSEAGSMLIDNIPFGNIFTGGGRIPISEAFTGVSTLTKKLTNQSDEYGNEITWDNVKSDMAESLPYWILPTGYSQVKKTINGLDLYNDDNPVAGSYTDSGDLRYTVEDDVGSKVQAAIFGAYANPYAQDYIDSGFKTIKKDNIEEMISLDMNSTEYREFKKNLSKVSNTSDKNGYKQYVDDNDNIYWYDSENEIMYDSNYDKTKLTEEDLTKVSKKEESLNYIDSLDLTDTQKNLVANNLNKNSKKTIDMSEYGNYSSYDEYMYARDYPKKYSVISQITNYDDYINYKDTISDIKKQYSTELGYESKERKTAVQNYINSLDLNVYQKMMLEKMAGGYSIKNYKNNIYEYLETTELTDSEKYTIWEELFN